MLPRLIQLLLHHHGNHLGVVGRRGRGGEWEGGREGGRKRGREGGRERGREGRKLIG